MPKLTISGKLITWAQYLTDTLDEYEGSHKNFELLDSGTNYVLAGRPAYMIVYMYENGDGVDLKEMEIGTKVGNDYYYFTHYADIELSLTEDMIASFRTSQDLIAQGQQR